MQNAVLPGVLYRLQRVAAIQDLQPAENTVTAEVGPMLGKSCYCFSLCQESGRGARPRILSPHRSWSLA